MNQKGFTLVEVLVAALLGALVVGGLGTLLLNAFKIAGKIESKTEFNSLVQSLELVLKDESLCASSLKNGKKFPESTVAKFDPDKKLDADELLASIQLKETVIAKLGQVFPYFSVSKLYFNEVDSSKREVLSPTETKYLVQLRLEATKANSLLNSSMKHDFLMWVTTKASVVESCMMKAEAPKVVRSISSTAMQNLAVFDKAGTYTFEIPETVTRIEIEVWGAGASGGAAGKGGHSGGYAMGYYDVQPGQSFSIIVGKGGIATRSPSSVEGEKSTFGSLIGAVGGSNTKLNPTETLFKPQVKINGSPGDYYYYDGPGFIGGNGGTAPRGGGGGSGGGWNYGNGYPGSWPGGGGGGSANYNGGGKGGNGADGGVIIKY